MQGLLEKRPCSTLKTGLNTSELSFSRVPSSSEIPESVAHAWVIASALLEMRDTGVGAGAAGAAGAGKRPVPPPEEMALLEMLLLRRICRQGQTEQTEGQQRDSGGSGELENGLPCGNSCVSSGA